MIVRSAGTLGYSPVCEAFSGMVDARATGQACRNSPPAPVSAPRHVSHEPKQPVYPQRVLKVLSAQVVLPLAESEPEKRAELLPVGVDCAVIRTPGNALENQEAVSGFNQAFSAAFAAWVPVSSVIVFSCTWGAAHTRSHRIRFSAAAWNFAPTAPGPFRRRI